MTQVAQVNDLVNLISSMAVPTTAVLHGKVIGGGLALATAVDRRLCLPDTTLNVALLPLGKSPVLMLMDTLPRVVGQGMTSRLYLENATVNTEHAVECGLVDQVVSDKADGERTASKLMLESLHERHWTPGKQVNLSHSAKEAVLLADLALKTKRIGDAAAKMAGSLPQKQARQDNTKSEVVQVIIRGVRSLLGVDVGQEIDLGAPLMEMGLDSLASTDLVRQLSKELDMELPPTLLFDYPTVNELSDHLAKLVSPEDQTPVQKHTKQDNTKSEVVQVITRVVRLLLSVDADQEIDADAPLMEMGLDSLASTELVQQLSQELDVQLPPTLLFDYPTVNELRDHLARLVAPEYQIEVFGVHGASSLDGDLPEVRVACESVLGDDLNLDDDLPLMEAGVDSLGATELVNVLNSSIGLELPSTLLFNHPTIGALTAHIVTQIQEPSRADEDTATGLSLRSDGHPVLLDDLINGKQSHPELMALPRHRSATGEQSVHVVGSSPAQEQMAILWSTMPDASHYNMPFVISLGYSIDRLALRRAMHHLVQRHEALRTVLRLSEAGRWLQHAYPIGDDDDANGNNGLKLLEWVDNSNELKANTAYHTAWAPFDLEHGPTLRAELITLPDLDERERTSYGLVLCAHHAILDGLSFGLLARDLGQFYSAFASGNESELAALPPPLTIQYPDYAAWRSACVGSATHAAQLEYWVERLDLAPPLDMVLDKARPPTLSGAGAFHYFTLDADLVARFKLTGARNRCTPFMTFLAAWQLLLCRHSRNHEIVVGILRDGRFRPELHDLIGTFTNVLAMRVDVLGKGGTFKELLWRVSECVQDAFSNDDVQFHEVVQALRQRGKLQEASNPVYQACFNYLPTVESLENQEFKVLPFTDWKGDKGEFPGMVLDHSPGTAEVEIKLTIADSDSLAGIIEYSTDLFEADTIARMVEHLRVLVGSAADAPDMLIRDLSIMDEAERHMVTAPAKR